MNDYLSYIYDKLQNTADFKKRDISSICGDIYLLFIDNLCDSKFISEYLIAPLMQMTKKTINSKIIKDKVLFGNSIDDVKSKDDAILHILSGDVVIVFENMENILYCEAKGFSKRAIQIPITEAVLKGPKEGFNESIMDNISLIRRRIKSPKLKVELYHLGKESNTTTALIYIQDKAPKSLVSKLKTTIKNIDTDFILDTNYIEEKLKKKMTPFDTIDYTEKADVASSKIFQGRAAIIVDGTPFVITAPYFFIENFQVPDDYYLNKIYSNMIRIIRFIAFGISTLLPGIYVALTTYHFSLIPMEFIFRLASSRAYVPFPTILEVLLMLFFFQLLREAGIRLPQPIGQSMSIVGALILGQSAVSAGLTSQSTVIIIALSSICSFLVPKLYGGIIIWSTAILILSSLIGIIGFFMGFFMMISHIASLDTCGYPFLLPLGTGKKLKYKDLIYRSNLDSISKNTLKNEDDKE
ncbi:spore germination protein [Clostridium tyrobutyricum]|uniref:spore germination protein n=1 Tax=Clostridium tyrobutyricum TaxID=1519 RepID=UPI001C38CD30|nr:spore germination protein [Clostridium tyrobutyricum]MBV4419194.1 spore germination protein [Clostridium tyrobutyricum]